MRKPRMLIGLLLLLFGVSSLCIQLDQPRLQALLPSDLITLVGAGLCLGVGLVMMIKHRINNRIARAP